MLAVEYENLLDKTPREDLRADDCMGVELSILSYTHAIGGIDGLDLDIDI